MLVLATVAAVLTLTNRAVLAAPPHEWEVQLHTDGGFDNKRFHEELEKFERSAGSHNGRTVIHPSAASTGRRLLSVETDQPSSRFGFVAVRNEHQQIQSSMLNLVDSIVDVVSHGWHLLPSPTISVNATFLHTFANDSTSAYDTNGLEGLHEAMSRKIKAVAERKKVCCFKVGGRGSNRVLLQAFQEPTIEITNQRFQPNRVVNIELTVGNLPQGSPLRNVRCSAVGQGGEGPSADLILADEVPNQQGVFMRGGRDEFSIINIGLGYDLDLFCAVPLAESSENLRFGPVEFDTKLGCTVASLAAQLDYLASLNIAGNTCANRELKRLEECQLTCADGYRQMADGPIPAQCKDAALEYPLDVECLSERDYFIRTSCSQSDLSSIPCPDTVCGVCFAGGQCTVDGTCICPPNWQGDSCQLDVNECFLEPNPCAEIEFARCQNTPGSFRCDGVIFNNTLSWLRQESITLEELLADTSLSKQDEKFTDPPTPAPAIDASTFTADLDTLTPEQLQEREQDLQEQVELLQKLLDSGADCTELELAVASAKDEVASSRRRLLQVETKASVLTLNELRSRANGQFDGRNALVPGIEVPYKFEFYMSLGNRSEFGPKWRVKYGPSNCFAHGDEQNGREQIVYDRKKCDPLWLYDCLQPSYDPATRRVICVVAPGLGVQMFVSVWTADPEKDKNAELVALSYDTLNYPSPTFTPGTLQRFLPISEDWSEAQPSLRGDDQSGATVRFEGTFLWLKKELTTRKNYYILENMVSMHMGPKTDLLMKNCTINPDTTDLLIVISFKGKKEDEFGANLLFTLYFGLNMNFQVTTTDSYSFPYLPEVRLVYSDICPVPVSPLSPEVSVPAIVTFFEGVNDCPTDGSTVITLVGKYFENSEVRVGAQECLEFETFGSQEGENIIRSVVGCEGTDADCR